MDALTIESIESRLTGAEREFRARLMDSTIASGRPWNLHAPPPPGCGDLDTGAMIAALLFKKAAVADEAGNVNFVYPVSALPTTHRVRLADGRQFFAMCAVDALGAAFAFGQDLHVESRCAECGAPVSAAVRDGRLHELSPPDLHVLHVDLNRCRNWAGSA